VPVANGTPEILENALTAMESAVQSFKASLPYTPPEQMDSRYINLQVDIAEAILGLYEELTDDDRPTE
jgi:hypothetical protein